MIKRIIAKIKRLLGVQPKKRMTADKVTVKGKFRKKTAKKRKGGK